MTGQISMAARHRGQDSHRPTRRIFETASAYGNRIERPDPTANTKEASTSFFGRREGIASITQYLFFTAITMTMTGGDELVTRTPADTTEVCRLHRDNGKSYAGEVVNWDAGGHGVMRYANGDQYVGQFAHSRGEGAGILVTESGERQEGNWHEDELIREAKPDTR